MRGGYFLNQDIKNFDNAFFGINNLEATHMDPQQRNLLEVVYECLESAGIRLEDVAGSNIGCYVGDFVYDYLVMQAKDDEEFHRYSPTGKGRTLLSNRISHTFDFRGPSMTLDTACSSSLYCLHTACRALLQGDCDAAVVASANLIQTPEQQMDVAASGVLSPTSACHTFDASADGYGRADAIGALYLKRLSDAIRDNDPIRSIIRATSTNSNGQTPGITLPSAKCQEAVIRKAYEFARLDPRETDYFECHGTGTPVGDPIEISAVAHFRASYASPDDYKECLIGSVKPNFGHSEAASGITSIIKATLALEHLQLPATIGIQTLNPAVPWKDYNLSVVRTLAQWPRADKDHIPRISVNSFGYGGANAHCILDNADAWIDHLLTLNKNIEIKKSRDENRVRRGINDEQAFLLPFSARNDTCATRRLDDTGSMKLEPDQLPDLAYTLSARRSTFEYRRFAVARSSSWSLDFKTASNSGYSQVVNTDNVPLIFVFTGQGSQWPQMGRRLFEVYSVFRNSILKLDHYLRSLPRSPSWSLIDVIFNDDTESIHHPSISQTACTAIQIALVDILRRWNVIPASVIGHSSGEICAAYAAGHISATYAIEIAYLRGLVVSTNTAAGCMIAASISFDDAQELIKELDLGLQACVACRNSPTNVTLSGDKYAIDLLHEALQSRGRFSRRLKTGGQAYHSHYMKKLGDMYEQLLRDALYRETSAMKYFPKQHPSCVSSLQVSMVSTVLKRPISYREAMDPAYWRANLESPVLFDIAVESLLTDQPQVFVEIGPHHALQMPVHQIEANHRAQGTQSKYYSALVRNRCSEMTALTLAGNLWTVGYDLDFEAVRQSYRWSSNSKPKVLNDLPNYSWDHSTILWKEPRVSAEYRNRQFPRDELIGSKVVGSNGRTETWRSMLDLANMSWLVEHKLGANVVLPGACYISMASRACQQLLSSTHQAKALEFRNVHIEKVMVLRHDSRLEVFTELRPLRLTSLVDHIFTWEFIISSMGNNRQTRHASGCIQALGAMDLISIPDVTIESSLERQSSRLWYSQFARQRLEFGSAFQSMESLFVPRKHDQMVAEAELKKLAENNLNEHRHLYPFDVHPIITDAAFQTGLVATARGEIEQLLGRVPVSIGRLHIFRTNSEDPYQIFRTKASAKVIGPGSALGQCQLLDRTGDTVLQVENIKVAPLQEMEIISMNRSSILKPVWIPDLSKLGQHNVEELCNIFPVGEPLKDSEVSTQFDSIKKIKQTISPNCKILYVGNLDQASYSPVFSTADTDGSNSSTKYTIGIPQNQGEICCLALTDERLPEPAEFVNYGFSLSAHEIKYDLIFLEDTSIRYDPRATDIRLLYMHLQPGGFILSSVKSLNDDASDSGIFLDDSASDGEKELDAFTNNLSNVLDVATIDLPTTKEGYHLTMALRSHYHTAPQEATIVILVQDLLHPLNASLLQTMQGNGFNTRIVLFNDVSVLEIQESSTIIVTAELERPIVANATKDQFTQIQLIASYASKVIWISGGRLVLASSPDYCAVLGLSRSIMAGNPAIQFAVLDIDETRLNISHTIANIQAIIEAMSDPGTDLEYLQKNGLLYISRLLPETTLNDDFDQKKKGTSKVVEIANTVQYELHIRDPGQFDTLEFRHAPFSDKLPSDHLVVLVKATGMNAKVNHLM